jgi:hypothetical protein
MVNFQFKTRRDIAPVLSVAEVRNASTCFLGNDRRLPHQKIINNVETLPFQENRATSLQIKIQNCF